MFKKYKDKIQSFIFLSLFLHISVYLFTVISFDPPKPKPQPIEIVVIDSKKQKRQIVEQNKKRINDETPEDSRFLSQHNQKVVEETVAQKHGKFTNQVTPGKNTRGQKTAQNKKAQAKPTKGNLPTLKQLKPKFSYTPNSRETHSSPAGKQARAMIT